MQELGFRGFRVLGFPSDQFAGQELETNEQIKTFARETYSINFDLFAKINVRLPDSSNIVASECPFRLGHTVYLDIANRIITELYLKVNGEEAEPVWRFLKEKQGGIIYSGIKWNFTKFLIDRNGVPVDR